MHVHMTTGILCWNVHGHRHNNYDDNNVYPDHWPSNSFGFRKQVNCCCLLFLFIFLWMNKNYLWLPLFKRIIKEILIVKYPKHKNKRKMWGIYYLPSDKYVFKMARCCWVISSSRAELKLGQNIHRNTVPIMANRSDEYDDPSFTPASFSVVFGRITALTAKPKYAPKACTVIEPPTSEICVIINYMHVNMKTKTDRKKTDIHAQTQTNPKSYADTFKWIK